MGLLLVHFGAFLDDLESAARARMNDVFSFSFSAAAAAGREGALAKASHIPTQCCPGKQI